MKISSCSGGYGERQDLKVFLSGVCGARKNIEIDETAHHIILRSDLDNLRAHLTNSLKGQAILGLVTSITTAANITPKELIILALFIPAAYGVGQFLRNRPYINRARTALNNLETSAKRLNAIEDQLVPYFETFQIEN